MLQLPIGVVGSSSRLCGIACRSMAVRKTPMPKCHDVRQFAPIQPRLRPSAASGALASPARLAGASAARSGADRIRSRRDTLRGTAQIHKVPLFVIAIGTKRVSDSLLFINEY
jgi:hypothetical protein